MATIKAEYYRLNGAVWDKYYFKTTADMVEGLNTAILAVSPAGARTPTAHNHDDRYYTEAEMNTLLSGKAASSHDHTILKKASRIDYGTSGLQWMDISGVGGTGANGQQPKNPYSDWFHHLIMNHANSTGYYTDIITAFHQDRIFFKRVEGGTHGDIQEFFHTGHLPTWGQVSGKPSFATVATSGSYNDLTNKPSIPSITGGATTITSNNLSKNKALISDGNGKVAISPVTSVQLGFLSDVTSNIQAQLGGKMSSSWTPSWGQVSGKPDLQLKATGAVSNIMNSNLTAWKVVSTDGNGKLVADAVNQADLANIAGSSGNFQTQINGKAASSHSHAWSAITSKPTNIIKQVSFSGGTMTIEVL